MASETKPSPCRVGDCFGRNGRSLAMTPGGACHGGHVRCAQCKLRVAISLPASVMASETKPSPCWVGDCFGRNGRSLAMTAGWAYRDCCRNQERSSILTIVLSNYECLATPFYWHNFRKANALVSIILIQIKPNAMVYFSFVWGYFLCTSDKRRSGFHIRRSIVHHTRNKFRDTSRNAKFISPPLDTQVGFPCPESKSKSIYGGIGIPPYWNHPLRFSERLMPCLDLIFPALFCPIKGLIRPLN